MVRTNLVSPGGHGASLVASMPHTPVHQHQGHPSHGRVRASLGHHHRHDTGGGSLSPSERCASCVVQRLRHFRSRPSSSAPASSCCHRHGVGSLALVLRLRFDRGKTSASLSRPWRRSPPFTRTVEALIPNEAMTLHSLGRLVGDSNTQGHIAANKGG